MEKKIRVTAAVLLTAFLFSLYVLILNRFQMAVWIPFLAFVLLLGCISVMPFRRMLPVGLQKRSEQLACLYRRMEAAFRAFFPERKFFLLVWIFLILASVPVWLSLFPGTLGYDTPVQVAEYFGESSHAMTSHHPLAHTFLLGGFFSLGNQGFHSYAAGFAIYIILQGLIVTGSIAYSLLFCYKHFVPLICLFAGMLWAATNPFLLVLIFNATKDVLFGAFLLCFCVSFGEALENDCREAYIRLAVFGILTCLFRNQGIYILLAVLPVCFICRLRKRGVYVCLLFVLLISQGFFTASENILHIPRGDKKEMLCVPMQQMARVCFNYLENDEEEPTITAKQYRAAAKLMGEEGIMAYLPDSTDNVKNHFQTDVLNGDFKKYFSSYISMGMQNPREYLLAWVDLIRPYWNLADNKYMGLTFSSTFPELDHWEIERGFEKGLPTKTFSRMAGIILNPASVRLWRPEICLWLLAVLPGLVIVRKQKILFLMILPMGLYFCTMILGPVALLRYLFPLAMAVPLFFCMLFWKTD